MLKQKISDQFLTILDQLEYGRFEIVLPDGRTRIYQGKYDGPQAQLHLNDWNVIKNLAVKGDVAFAEDYRNGYWESKDLEALFSFALKNDKVIGKYLFGSRFSQIMSRISYLMRLNTIKGSRKNIHEHYDLGNEFYKLWLDKTMSYSAALFNSPHETLEQAQYNKYDRIINCMPTNSGKLLEIGCGWGGFAERVLEKSDFLVKGITISQEQYTFSKQRLNDKAYIALEDYRDQKGLYDSIVSIEMFEAVGEKYWPIYFKKIKSLLNKDGKAVIQTITIDDKIFDRYKRSGDMIRSYIFPGGMLPSENLFAQQANNAGLQISEKITFGLDYAETLSRWLHRFDLQQNAVRDLGFDDKFIRLWRFYLAACIAGFKTGRTNVMQVSLGHA